MNKKNRGFTLISVLIVVAIICVAAAVWIPALQKQSKSKAEISKTKCPETFMQPGEILKDPRYDDSIVSWVVEIPGQDRTEIQLWKAESG